MKTITIDKQFFKGTMEISEEDFSKKWISWSYDFGTLCSDSEDWIKYKKLVAWTEELAKKSFNKEHKKQLQNKIENFRKEMKDESL